MAITPMISDPVARLTDMPALPASVLITRAPEYVTAPRRSR
jgi:hypothetical protein